MANILNEQIEFLGGFFPKNLIYTIRLVAIKERSSINKITQKILEDWNTVTGYQHSILIKDISDHLIETWTINETDKEVLPKFKQKVKEDLMKKKVRRQDIQSVIKQFESKINKG
jgi:hypothetical protein